MNNSEEFRDIPYWIPPNGSKRLKHFAIFWFNIGKIFLIGSLGGWLCPELLGNFQDFGQYGLKPI